MFPAGDLGLSWLPADEGSVELTHEIAGQKIADKVVVRPGENVFIHNLTIRNPKLWWPNGQGEQPLYELWTTLDGERTTRRIGLRKLEWIVEKALGIAGDICIYTNHNVTIEEL